MEIGIVKGFEKRKNKDSERIQVLLTVEITDVEDVQTVELMNDDGVDSIPVNEARVLIGDIGIAYKIAFAVDDLIPNQILNAGEKKIYSSDGDGNILNFISFLENRIEINGNNDFAVRFTALDTAFQQLITDINAALGTKTDGSGTAGTLTLDISGAKVDTVKII